MFLQINTVIRYIVCLMSQDNKSNNKIIQGRWNIASGLALDVYKNLKDMDCQELNQTDR